MPKNKAHVQFDERAKKLFIENLERTGRIEDSCTAAGISSQTMRNHLKTDAAFKAAYDVAYGRFRDAIEAEIYRRGITGWEEPVYQKGERVRDVDGPAVIRKFSDRMLELVAKRHIPEYRDRVTVDANVRGGVLVLSGRSMTDKQWEEQYGGRLPAGSGKRPTAH